MRRGATRDRTTPDPAPRRIPSTRRIFDRCAASLDAFLDTLDDSDRRLVSLRFEQGLSQREAADELGVGRQVLRRRERDVGAALLEHLRKTREGELASVSALISLASVLLERLLEAPMLNLRRRRLDDYLLEGPRSRHARWARALLRRDARARAHYDRGLLALRALEAGRRLEARGLDLVEGRLFDDAPAAAGLRGMAHRILAALRRRGRAWSTLGAVTLAAALLVWIQPSGDDGFTRRGEVPAGALAVQAMCGEPLRDASDGCLLSEPLTFAYRLRAPVLADAASSASPVRRRHTRRRPSMTC